MRAVGEKIVNGLYNAGASIYNGYSLGYEKLPTRAQHAVSTVTKGGIACGLYYLSGLKTERICHTFTPGIFWVMNVGYQGGKCLVSHCDQKVLEESLKCGFPLIIKGGMLVAAVGCAGLAAVHLGSIFAPAQRAN